MLNGTLSALDGVVPMEYTRKKPKKLEQDFDITYGVLIGMTGDLKAKLVLSGEASTFSRIAETMYGMPLEGDMLVSFSGELGNMIAGGLTANIEEKGININITAPTMMQGKAKLSGFKQGLCAPISFTETGHLDIYLLLD